MTNTNFNNGRPLMGLVAATFTPLAQDASLDLARIPDLVEHLVKHGIAGMYVLGSTGEGVSFTYQERCEIAEAYVQAAAGRLPVIIQVGCESLAQAQQLAAHAEQIGADAISAISPVYFKPPSLEVLVESMASVAASAPKLPFFYYHIPGLTGVDYCMKEFLSLAANDIPTLAGIKYSSHDLEAYRSCVEFAGEKFQLLWGADEMLCDGLAAGARAAIGSTYNFIAPIHQRLLAAFNEGDMEAARSEQRHVQAIVEIFLSYGRSAQKAIMAMIDMDCGPTRLPMKTLTVEQAETMQSQLAAVGCFECETKSNA